MNSVQLIKVEHFFCRFVEMQTSLSVGTYEVRGDQSLSGERKDETGLKLEWNIPFTGHGLEEWMFLETEETHSSFSHSLVQMNPSLFSSLFPSLYSLLFFMSIYLSIYEIIVQFHFFHQCKAEVSDLRFHLRCAS